jgi:hypothetical protein
MRQSIRLCLLVFVLALLIRAGGMRDSSIRSFPPGIWFDEALKGVDAWNSLHGGGLKLVYPDVFPREPLLVWIQSVVLWIAGPRILAMRVVMTIIGSLTCVAFFLMVISLNRGRSPGFALAAAFVLATLHWHAWFSRLIFRTNLVPLAACLLVLAMAAAARRRGARRGRILAWIGAGAVAGAGFYTYTSWHFFLPVILVWFWALTGEFAGKETETVLSSQSSVLGSRFSVVSSQSSLLNPQSPIRNPQSAIPNPQSPIPNPQSPIPNPQSPILSPQSSALSTQSFFLACFACGALLVMLPLILHYLLTPADLINRPQAVSPFRDGFLPGLLLIVRNLRDVLLMFAVRGDHVPLHNVPWTPVFDPVWAVLFTAGIARAVWDVWRRGEGWRFSTAWLAWLVCMSCPSVVTQTDSANTLRNLGATPAVAYFVALGWWWTGEAVRHKSVGQSASLPVGRIGRIRRIGWIGLSSISRFFHPQSAIRNPQSAILSTQHSALHWLKAAEALLLAALVWGAGCQVYKLWVRHPHTAATIEKFCNTNVWLARFCQPDFSGSPLFVPVDFTASGKDISARNYAFQFLTIQRRDIRPFDPVQALSRPTEGKPKDHRVLCAVFLPYSQVLQRLFPGGYVERALVLGRERETGRELAQVLVLSADGGLQRAFSLAPDGGMEEAPPMRQGQPLAWIAWIFRIPASALLRPEQAREAARSFSPTTETQSRSE